MPKIEENLVKRMSLDTTAIQKPVVISTIILKKPKLMQSKRPNAEFIQKTQMLSYT